uniref:Uncharacterized protein n=1 Tax=Candidatus Kentrum sp. FW TaxID=2126338 RepID=A0A450TK09_9GAMM|nr:MAG: hypothetical protein BECKFW1821A_GA0114235_106816 [Candidatus Kentron sp. FW]VFJ67820.1 MAG: hypothetical protein BECKFW1821B_GA0114236_11356 [Candidatus Kentron sp. FW]
MEILSGNNYCRIEYTEDPRTENHQIELFDANENDSFIGKDHYLEFIVNSDGKVIPQ